MSRLLHARLCVWCVGTGEGTAAQYEYEVALCSVFATEPQYHQRYTCALFLAAETKQVLRILMCLSDDTCQMDYGEQKYISFTMFHIKMHTEQCAYSLSKVMLHSEDST